MDNDLGDRLKNLRIQKGFTQEQLGNLVGLTKQAISRMEKNKNKYSDNELIKRIAFHLSCTPDYLLGLSNDKHKLKNDKTQVISFDPDGDIKDSMKLLSIKDGEFFELVLECQDKLNKADLYVIKRIMKSLLLENENL